MHIAHELGVFAVCSHVLHSSSHAANTHTNKHMIQCLSISPYQGWKMASKKLALKKTKKPQSKVQN